MESELEGDIDLRGFLGLASDVPKGYTEIRVKFMVKTDEQNMERLKSLAAFSPVYNSLINGVKVDIQVEPKIGYRFGGAIRDAVSLTWPTRATTHP